MKTNQAFTSCKEIAWQQVNENVSMKLLNGNTQSGPHTAILKSKPRAPDPHRGQYHPVDEEFYCLGGRFTFDGTRWFRKGSYVHFPAFCVHGANVHVAEGYLLYLRMGGPVTTEYVKNPKSDFPYPFETQPMSTDPTVHQRVMMAGKTVHKHGGQDVKSRLLKGKARSGEGTTLVSVEKSASGKHVVMKSANELEVFVVSGDYEDDSSVPVKAGTYAYYSGPSVELHLRSISAGRMLVSHGSALSINLT